MKINIIILLFFTIFIYSCDKDNNPQNNPKTLIIAHRSAGNIWYNDTADNSFEAIEYRYNKLDGIELDLQISKDSTIWLIHDNEILNCNNDTLAFCYLSDNEIIKISECTPGNLFTLEDLFKYLSIAENRKFVSLDIKAVTNTDCLNKFSSEELNELVSKIIVNLYNKYNPNCTLAVESWDINFLELIEQKNSEIETYFLLWNSLTEDDLMYIKNKTLDGLSCNYSTTIDKKIIDKAKLLDLKIQLWTPNDADDLIKTLSLNPFSIQTDNIKYFINE